MLAGSKHSSHTGARTKKNDIMMNGGGGIANVAAVLRWKGQFDMIVKRPCNMQPTKPSPLRCCFLLFDDLM